MAGPYPCLRRPYGEALRWPAYNSRVHVLITGGAGFIGSHLADALLARGDKVTVLDNFDPYYDPALKWANVEPAQDFKTYALVEGDVCDAAAVEQLLARAAPDAIVHLAALAGVRDSLDQPLRFTVVIVRGTLIWREEM